MTSRVEAVARALAPNAWAIWDRATDGSELQKEIEPEILRSMNDAKRALEANDAWLKKRGWKAVPQEATENMLVEGAFCLPATPEDSIAYSCWEPGNSTMREDASNDWRRMWNEAPEVPDQ